MDDRERVKTAILLAQPSIIRYPSMFISVRGLGHSRKRAGPRKRAGLCAGMEGIPATGQLKVSRRILAYGVGPCTRESRVTVVSKPHPSGFGVLVFVFDEATRPNSFGASQRVLYWHGQQGLHGTSICLGTIRHTQTWYSWRSVYGTHTV